MLGQQLTAASTRRDRGAVAVDARQRDEPLARLRVARRALLGGPVWGHLHVEAFYGPSLVATADTRWTQLARGRLPASFFQVRLPNTARPIDVIRVSHMYADHRKARASGNPS